MSILDPYILAATQLGVSLTSPVSKPAIVFVLQKADALGLMYYKTGMESDWLAAAQLWGRKHSRTLTGQDLLAGVLHLATEPSTGSFLKPYELFNAVTVYESQQRRRALGARQAPELPLEFETAGIEQEQAYFRAWRKAAAVTGDYEQATTQARAAVGLPPEPPSQIEPHSIPVKSSNSPVDE